MMAVIFNNLMAFVKVSDCLDFHCSPAGCLVSSGGRKLHTQLVWLKQAQGTRAAGRKWLLWPLWLLEKQRMNPKVKGHSQKFLAKLINKARRAWGGRLGGEPVGQSWWLRSRTHSRKSQQEHSPGKQPKDELASLVMNKARAAGHPLTHWSSLFLSGYSSPCP